MKEFIRVLLYTILLQILSWGIFIYFNELTGYMGLNFITLIILLIPIFLYFIFNKKIIPRDKLDSKRFNIYLSISWLLFSILMIILTAKFIPYFEDLGIFHKCYFLCILDGVEYFFFGMGMIFQVILISVFKLCGYLYKKIKEVN